MKLRILVHWKRNIFKLLPRGKPIALQRAGFVGLVFGRMPPQWRMIALLQAGRIILELAWLRDQRARSRSVLDWGASPAMHGFYPRWIDIWERRLSQRDSNRKIRPFEWGLDWLGISQPAKDPAACVREYARRAAGCSEQFFSYERPEDFTFNRGRLSFTSPVCSFFPENNRVQADLFSSGRDRGRAVVVLPQWNADASGHVSLCKLLNKFGVTALRMSMPYHDRRKPAELERADYHVSSNIGRTIQACRQSVIDTRCCLDWLESRGYKHLGVVGTSLGSCIAFIAAAHDERVSAGVFNHVSMYFGDVVWTGLATRHVRLGFADEITQDDLRDCWRAISPATYIGRMASRDMTALLIWARYDTTFLPEYSQQFISSITETGCKVQVASLPCGHYTTGEFPFNLRDAFLVCRFLSSNL